MQHEHKKVLICTHYRANPNNPSCGARDSQALIPALEIQLQKHNIHLVVEESACLGLCQVGPNVRLIPNGAFFNHVSPASLDPIVKATKAFLNNNSLKK
jgi:(2Fe-2S) ferredoxin